MESLLYQEWLFKCPLVLLSGHSVALTIYVLLFKKLQDKKKNLRDNHFFSHFKMSQEMAKKVIVAKKKIMYPIFFNNGTLVILCLFETMGSQFIVFWQFFKCLKERGKKYSVKSP